MRNPSDNRQFDLDAGRERLLAILADLDSAAVAFSGGVDSAVVAKAAAIALGDRAVAVTAVSPSLASGELEEAKQTAELIDIRHELLHTNELARSGYVANAGDRCFYCKTELYELLSAQRERFAFDVILNGANLDDRGDHRPGMVAATNFRVRSPLIEAGFDKAAVRALAKAWKLPVWEKPASPCLSSRIAYGTSVTPERLKRIDAAERFLKDLLGERELRVRVEANELARIEVPLTALHRLVKPGVREQITGMLHELGFRAVTLDLDGFRSGNLNALVRLDTQTDNSEGRRAKAVDQLK